MAIVNPAALVPTTPSQGISILFGVAQLLGNKPARVSLDTFTIDCTLTEALDLEADISEFEVESGSNISDNRRTKPIEISISGIVSDTPIQETSLIAEAVRLAAGPLNIAIDAFNALTNTSVAASISSQAFYKLQSLFEFGSLGSDNGLFSVVTSFRVYDNMTIKSLRFTRDAKTGKALVFTCSLREIRSVTTATTFIFSPPMLQSPVNAGTKSPGVSKLNVDSDYSSWLDKTGLKRAPVTVTIGPATILH